MSRSALYLSVCAAALLLSPARAQTSDPSGLLASTGYDKIEVERLGGDLVKIEAQQGAGSVEVVYDTGTGEVTSTEIYGAGVSGAGDTGSVLSDDVIGAAISVLEGNGYQEFEVSTREDGNFKVETDGPDGETEFTVDADTGEISIDDDGDDDHDDDGPDDDGDDDHDDDHDDDGDDDHDDDGPDHDGDDDHGDDGPGHDAGDDHGDDGPDHDSGDDHGDDGGDHDGGDHDGGDHDGGDHDGGGDHGDDGGDDD